MEIRKKLGIAGGLAALLFATGCGENTSAQFQSESKSKTEVPIKVEAEPKKIEYIEGTVIEESSASGDYTFSLRTKDKPAVIDIDTTYNGFNKTIYPRSVNALIQPGTKLRIDKSIFQPTSKFSYSIDAKKFLDNVEFLDEEKKE